MPFLIKLTFSQKLQGVKRNIYSTCTLGFDLTGYLNSDNRIGSGLDNMPFASFRHLLSAVLNSVDFLKNYKALKETFSSLLSLSSPERIKYKYKLF